MTSTVIAPPGADVRPPVRTPRTGRRAPLPPAVPIIAALVSLGAIIWSVHTGSILLYNDARAHLDIARRVTDSAQPGLTQLGSVWLPVPHLLLVPFTASATLWHDGLAGAIVGGAAFTFSAVHLWQLVEEVSSSRLAAWCGFLFYIGNLNLLYVQTTALTEPVLLAFFVAGVHYLVRWMRTGSLEDFIWSGLLTMAAILTRYDGWFLWLAELAVIALWSRARQRHAKETEAHLVVYALLGGFGVGMWALYNLLIFHDPLYFLRSTFSAGAQQQVLAAKHALGTKGDPLRSLVTYGWAAIDVCGPLAAVVTVVGAAVTVSRRFAERGRTLAALTLLAAPIAFNVLALLIGQSAIEVPQVAPFGLYNDRYGLLALPFVAVAGALIVARWRRLVLPVVAVATTSLVLAASGTPITLQDGRSGISSATAGRPEVVADYLRAHYAGGTVLADDSWAAPVIFASHLDLKDFLTNDDPVPYTAALADPGPGAGISWVLTFSQDQVFFDQLAHPAWFRSYRLVSRFNRYSLYERIPDPVAAPAP